jgi:hypothetical protein
MEGDFEEGQEMGEDGGEDMDDGQSPEGQYMDE